MTSKNISGLLHFLENSPTPLHAVSNLKTLFCEHGFIELDEKDDWDLKKSGKYFTIRSDSSIVAFVCGDDLGHKGGLRLVGAHSDSPCLKVKPRPEIVKNGYLQLGVEVYGGVLLNPWFDRDLSLAGKVNGLDAQGNTVSALIDFKRAIAIIPSLAIHLDRQANSNKSVNAQKEMSAILCGNHDSATWTTQLLSQVKSDNPSLNMTKILDFNLSFYDAQAPIVIGLQNDFLASARLDNLLSSYIGAKALLSTLNPADTNATGVTNSTGVRNSTCVFVCHDHEEIGSRSEGGAQGTLLNDVITRLMCDPIDRQRSLRKSLMLSVDNAHGIHPNYPDKHDLAHGPELNQGPVIKFNANQSYATSSDTASVLRVLAAHMNDEAIPLQDFVMRSDMACGSTIGPITSANVGLKTVDLGVATFAMHSIRELAGVRDIDYLHDLLQRFYACDSLPF